MTCQNNLKLTAGRIMTPQAAQARPRGGGGGAGVRPHPPFGGENFFFSFFFLVIYRGW